MYEVVLMQQKKNKIKYKNNGKHNQEVHYRAINKMNPSISSTENRLTKSLSVRGRRERETEQKNTCHPQNATLGPALTLVCLFFLSLSSSSKNKARERDGSGLNVSLYGAWWFGTHTRTQSHTQSHTVNHTHTLTHKHCTL